MAGDRKEREFDYCIPISGPTVTVRELMEIFEGMGFAVEDYWLGAVDGRRLYLRRVK